MKIGIIGAGFTGLAAAFYLSKKGHKVTLFEKDEKPGGLAIGYQETGWSWSLEAHYHHWFTNDKSVLDLAKAINHKVIIKRPKTSSFVNGKIYQLDSPTSLLKFPELNMFSRLRMGISLAALRFNPFWKPLENYYAKPYLIKSMGRSAYKKIWEPLMVNKLGKYAEKVSLAWFWARIYKRTPSLAYPEGGFLNFAQHIEREIKKRGGKFYYNTDVSKVYSNGKPTLEYEARGDATGGPPTNARNTVRTSGGGEERQDPELLEFDAVIVTLPTMLFFKIAKDLPKSYIDKYSSLKNIGAMNLVLRLKKPFLKDGSYWLNMCDLKSPILAIVEHTNFMDKKNYNNEYLVYLGNYMETTDKRYRMSKEELLKLYDPWLKKINPNFQLSILNSQLFHAPFAQPIIPPHYSKKIPSFKTPLKNVYLANIQQVYPWDRGTNYAVELGKKAAEKINKN